MGNTHFAGGREDLCEGRARTAVSMALAGACAITLVVFALSNRAGDPLRLPAEREALAVATEEDPGTLALVNLRPLQRTEVPGEPTTQNGTVLDRPSPSTPVVLARAQQQPIQVNGDRVSADRYTLHNGYLTILHPDGSPAERGNWDGKLRQGDWEYFSEEGQLELQSFYVDGVAEGHGTLWYPDGRVADRAVVRNGELHGTRVRWNRDGSLDAELSGEYVDGVKVH